MSQDKYKILNWELFGRTDKKHRHYVTIPTDLIFGRLGNLSLPAFKSFMEVLALCASSNTEVFDKCDVSVALVLKKRGVSVNDVLREFEENQLVTHLMREREIDRETENNRKLSFEAASKEGEALQHKENNSPPTDPIELAKKRIKSEQENPRKPLKEILNDKIK